MVHGELGHGVVQLEDMILNLLWLDFIAWRGWGWVNPLTHLSSPVAAVRKLRHPTCTAEISDYWWVFDA